MKKVIPNRTFEVEELEKLRGKIQKKLGNLITINLLMTNMSKSVFSVDSDNDDDYEKKETYESLLSMEEEQLVMLDGYIGEIIGGYIDYLNNDSEKFTKNNLQNINAG
jgi:hypothetical protein